METTAQKLVNQYMPLANKIAHQRKRVLPPFIGFDELQSAAYMGLVEAASRYRPEVGVAFSTFAYPRISGAIQDYLREQGWGKDRKAFSLDGFDSQEECCLRDTLAAKEELNQDEMMEVISLDLGPQAEQILRYYFIDEFSMREVGEKFGVSESRISQLISRYKKRISDRWTVEDLSSELAA